MNYKTKIISLIIVTSFISTNVFANNEREELLELKNTITNLIDELVTAGVLAEDKASLMKQTASAKAKVQAAKEAEDEEKAEQEQKIADSKAVRVQYVPDHVKQEIRDQVRNELRQEVVGDVMAQAKNERWGVPEALPEWVGKLKLSGDVRLREQGDFYSNDIDFDIDNDGRRDVAPDFIALNNDQVNTAATKVTQNPDKYFEERVRSRNRLRERFRLSLDAEVTTNLKVGARLSTGNISDPVSTNQTLGNTGDRFDVQLDRAYIKYTDLNPDAYPWLTFYGGRFKNPFYSSSLVFDKDLSFQGLAIGLKHNLAGSNSLLDIEDDTKTMFVNMGAFPLQEFDVAADDKWLFGGQVGAQFIFRDQSNLKFAVSYYDYINTQGRRNAVFDAGGAANATTTFQAYDFTAPEFVQGGNTMFDIRNDTNASNHLDSALYALASDYNLINFTGRYDWAALAPVHLIFDFDFVKNIGYDKKDILERIVEGGNGTAEIYQDQFITANQSSLLEERTTGYSFKLTTGWPSTILKGRWQVFAGYKYLQRDAVLDAFADSDFHLGGTNAKGFMLGGKFGLNENTWLRGRWMSTDTIDGPKVGIDILQFDLNAKF